MPSTSTPKRVFLSLLSVALCTGVAAAQADDAPENKLPAASTAPSPPSGLVVAPQSFDFGDVAPGDVVNGEVWLINASQDVIEVDTAKAGCGCTTLAFKPMMLKPGTAERVTFAIDAPKEDGKKKTVKLNFGPTWGQVESASVSFVTSTGASAADSPRTIRRVQRDLLVLPEAGHLGTLAGGVSHDVSAWLINRGQSVQSVRAISSGCGCTSIVGFTPGDIAPNMATRVRLRVTPKNIEKDNKIVTLTVVPIEGTPVQTELGMRVEVTPELDAPDESDAASGSA